MGKAHKIGLAAAGLAAAAGASYLALNDGGGHKAHQEKPVERHQMRSSPNPKPPLPPVVGERQQNRVTEINWAVMAATRCMLDSTVQPGMHVQGSDMITNAGSTAGPDGKKGTADDLPLISMGRGQSGQLSYSIKFRGKTLSTTVVSNPDEAAFKGTPDTHTMLEAGFNAMRSGWSLEVSEGQNTTQVTRGPNDTMTEWRISQNHAAPHKATDEEFRQVEIGVMTMLAGAVVHSGSKACLPENVVILPEGVTLPGSTSTGPSVSGSGQPPSSSPPSSSAPAAWAS